MNFHQRNLEIASLYRAGIVASEIGLRFSISSQRVFQILSKLGISGVDGGVHKQHLSYVHNRRISIAARSDVRAKRAYGVSASTLDAILSLYGRAVLKKYITQKKNAAKRKIQWQLTLKEWVDFWTSSGVFHRRGLGRGSYVMGRYGDVGPYKIGNIFAHEAIENILDGRRRLRKNYQSCKKKKAPEETHGALSE